MSFEYSCFISYCHAQGRLVEGFVNQVRDALTDELGGLLTEFKIYIDKERLQPGYLYDNALAGAICRSMCMLVIYSPPYQESRYCQRELMGMQILQDRRLRLLEATVARERGLIIPVVLRGWGNLPSNIRHAQASDFSTFSLSTTELRHNGEFTPKFRTIATYIAELRDCFKRVNVNPCADCESFELPPESDVVVHTRAAEDLPFSRATA